MPMKLCGRLNEQESDAVRALLSLGEMPVCQTSYRTPVKKQPEAFSYAKPLQPQQLNVSEPHRSVITKVEVALGQDERQQTHQPYQPVTSQISPPLPSAQNTFNRDSGFTSTLNNHQSTIKFGPVTPLNLNNNLAIISSTATNSSASSSAPVSTLAINSNTSSPMMPTTILYQIPASISTTGSTTNGSNLTTTGVIQPTTLTLVPTGRGYATLSLPVVTGNGTSTSTLNNVATLNWNNIKVLKMPSNNASTSNGEKTGVLTPYSTLAPLTTLPKDKINTTPTKLLPIPGKSDGKSSVTTPTANNGKSPTKSRARRRSQTAPKGQSRKARASSSVSAEFIVSPAVEGLPNIVADGYEIPREIWAKMFLQQDIIHAAGILFNCLFSADEIKNCTLNGRNGTRQLSPEKREVIFKIVAWSKVKNQDPYSFSRSPDNTKILSKEEQQMIEKKVFVERRYQTSRKIRDLAGASSGDAKLPLPSSFTSTHTQSGPNMSPASIQLNNSPSLYSPPLPSTSNLILSPTQNKTLTTPKKCTASVVSTSSSATPPDYNSQRRDSTGSFSSICSSTGDDKGIPKISLIQSSEIIANYFQSAEPLPITAPTPLIHLSNQTIDGPPPMKMQKVG